MTLNIGGALARIPYAVPIVFVPNGRSRPAGMGCMPLANVVLGYSRPHTLIGVSNRAMKPTK